MALVLAATGHWDLVLTDMDLPVMSGAELLAALRQLAPALPVAVVSAHVLGRGAGRAARVPRTATWRSRCGWTSSWRPRPR